MARINEKAMSAALEALSAADAPNAEATALEYGVRPRTLRERFAKVKTTGVDRLLLIPDTHVPFHDERAWALMMDVARALKPDTIIHLGDLGDFYSVSSHSKDPERMQGFSSELDAVREKRAELDSLGAKRKVFVEGNHCFRLIRYLHDKAPELAGIVSLDELLHLTENGWEHVPYRSYGRVGKLYVTHDTAQGGKYSTARALETFQHSVAIGHHHQIQYFVGGDATGQHQVAAQFGWLGDVSKVDYMHTVKAHRSWSLGFGIGHHDLTTEYVYLQPMPIVEYTVCFEGRVFRG